MQSRHLLFVKSSGLWKMTPISVCHLYQLNLSFIEKSLGNKAKHLSHGAKIELCHKESILRSVATFKVSDLSVVFFVAPVVAFVYNCCHHDQLLLPRCLWMDGDGRGNAVLESCQSIQCHYKQEIFLWICLG